MECLTTPAQGDAPSVKGGRVWLLAARPRTLSMAIAPVLVGAVLAWHEKALLALLPTVAALLGAIFIQIGTNLYNDVADFERGGDLPERIGPVRVTAMGWASPAQVRCWAFMAFGLAALAGLYIIYWGGWLFLLLGVVSILAGLAYSGGPKPISATPFSEAVVIAFFGIAAVCGTYFLVTGDVSPAALIVGTAMGLLAAAVLHVNNTRDHDADVSAGRRTLAILLGKARSRVMYAAFVVSPVVLLLVLPTVLQGGEQSLLSWLPLFLYPFLAVGAVRAFWSAETGPAFNALLSRSGKLQLIMAILLSISLIA